MNEQWGLDCRRLETSARLLWTINRVFGALAIAFVGCSSDEGASVDEYAIAMEVDVPPAATKPTGSQDCNLGGDEALRVSLGQEGEFSHFLRRSDAIALRVTKELEVPGTLVLEAVVTAVDSPDARFAVPQPVAGTTEVINTSLPLSNISLPSHSLETSRQLTIHARFVSEGGSTHATASSVQLYFHPHEDGWQFYDEAVRDRDYSGGALTEAERTKRAAALASLPAGASAEYVNVRVTKLSDDAEYIPPDDAAGEETP